MTPASVLDVITRPLGLGSLGMSAVNSRVLRPEAPFLLSLQIFYPSLCPSQGHRTLGFS
jgi:hypothetical protein